MSSLTTSLVSASSGFSSNPLWYTARSTGVAAFLLLTATTVLGVASTQRALASRAWPRFATQALHRNIALLSMGFLIVHMLATLLDSYVVVGWWSVLVPWLSPYKRSWLGLGTVAWDLLVVVTLTSLLRTRLSARLWRGLHLTSYAAWLVALVHFLYIGTDARSYRWGFWLGVACLIWVGTAAVARLLTREQPTGPVRSVVRGGR